MRGHSRKNSFCESSSVLGPGWHNGPRSHIYYPWSLMTAGELMKLPTPLSTPFVAFSDVRHDEKRDRTLDLLASAPSHGGCLSAAEGTPESEPASTFVMTPLAPAPLPGEIKRAYRFAAALPAPVPSLNLAVDELRPYHSLHALSAEGFSAGLAMKADHGVTTYRRAPATPTKVVGVRGQAEPEAGHKSEPSTGLLVTKEKLTAQIEQKMQQRATNPAAVASQSARALSSAARDHAIVASRQMLQEACPGHEGGSHTDRPSQRRTDSNQPRTRPRPHQREIGLAVHHEVRPVDTQVLRSAVTETTAQRLPQQSVVKAHEGSMDGQQSRMRERAGSTKDVRRHPGLERTDSVEDKKCWSSVRNSSAVDQDLGRFRAFYQMGWLPYNFMDSPRRRGHDKSLEAARIARTSDLPLDQITSQISAADHGASNPKDSGASRQRLHGGHASDHFPPPPNSESGLHLMEDGNEGDKSPTPANLAKMLREAPLGQIASDWERGSTAVSARQRMSRGGTGGSHDRKGAKERVQWSQRVVKPVVGPRNKTALQAEFDDKHFQSARARKTTAGERGVREESQEPQNREYERHLQPGTEQLTPANEGLVKPSSQRILVRTPRERKRGVQFPMYCKHHKWCSLPCIECSALKMYGASDGSVRPSQSALMPGAGASYSFVDLGDAHDQASGATYAPAFTQAAPVPALQRLKRAVMKRYSTVPRQHPPNTVDQQTRFQELSTEDTQREHVAKDSGRRISTTQKILKRGQSKRQHLLDEKMAQEQEQQQRKSHVVNALYRNTLTTPRASTQPIFPRPGTQQQLLNNTHQQQVLVLPSPSVGPSTAMDSSMASATPALADPLMAAAWQGLRNERLQSSQFSRPHGKRDASRSSASHMPNKVVDGSDIGSASFEALISALDLAVGDTDKTSATSLYRSHPPQRKSLKAQRKSGGALPEATGIRIKSGMRVPATSARGGIGGSDNVRVRRVPVEIEPEESSDRVLDLTKAGPLEVVRVSHHIRIPVLEEKMAVAEEAH